MQQNIVTQHCRVQFGRHSVTTLRNTESQHRNTSASHLLKSYVRVMAKRIIDVRQRFRAALEEINTPGSWEHITSQTGMFSLTGLSRDQVRYLKEKHHVYLLSSGRYNMCALNDSNIHYVASAVKDAFLSVHTEDGCIKNGSSLVYRRSDALDHAATEVGAFTIV
uniref:aspartate transaminase n=1 Tax=Timema tahoe TaxID=61484 RepID=A0A7R9INY2_9NEOP|nr:unnamed protein product [Timema tahoe]